MRSRVSPEEAKGGAAPASAIPGPQMRGTWGTQLLGSSVDHEGAGEGCVGGGWADEDFIVAGSEVPAFVGFAEGFEHARIDGDGDGLRLAGGERDARKAGEAFPGFVGALREGCVDLRDFSAGARAGIADGEAQRFWRMSPRSGRSRRMWCRTSRSRRGRAASCARPDTTCSRFLRLQCR